LKALAGWKRSVVEQDATNIGKIKSQIAGGKGMDLVNAKSVEGNQESSGFMRVRLSLNARHLL
jgi:hypothetical protein